MCVGYSIWAGYKTGSVDSYMLICILQPTNAHRIPKEYGDQYMYFW